MSDIWTICSLFHASASHGRSADANAAGDERRCRIEWNHILIECDSGLLQRLICYFSGDAFLEQFDDHEMIVCSARNQIEPILLQPLRQHAAFLTTWN